MMRASSSTSAPGGWQNATTVLALLHDAATRAPDGEAVVFGDVRLSYRDYLRAVAGFAANLRALGAANSRVALLCGNSADAAVATLAIQAAGAAFCPMNPAYTARELRQILTGCRPSSAVCDAACAPLVRTLALKAGIAHVGMPLPGTKVQIVDAQTGQPLPASQPGEIRARGPQIMLGYWNRPEETAAALRDGWLHTGDIGAIDADGHLAILDRLKDMVITGGYNVYPREVDEVLLMHPAVREAASFGIPHAYRGEVLHARVVLRHPAAVEDILAHCRANLAKYKVPVSLVVVETIPQTSVGKIDKAALRRGE